jgi:hypothetical protein
MKTQVKMLEYKNKVTGEFFYTPSPLKKKVIDGVEFIPVVAEGYPREALLRLDALQFIKSFNIR